jgi:hypothetical protein
MRVAWPKLLAKREYISLEQSVCYPVNITTCTMTQVEIEAMPPAEAINHALAAVVLNIGE